jgi:hypothetical protein
LTGKDLKRYHYPAGDTLVEGRIRQYDRGMILIRFPDAQSERRALGFLAGRFAFKSWATGETLVPESALASLAVEGIPFTVEGPATYERNIPALRNPAPTAVQ